MAKIRTADDITRSMLDTIRRIDENANYKKAQLNEESNDSDRTPGAIAITDDPMFGDKVLTNQILQFRSSVEGGAQFTKPSESSVEESPLVYIPKDGNLLFSGTIPCLNNLKWQFVLKTTTGNGCFTWCDGLILNKDNMQILNKLYGFYVNWRESWNEEAADLERLANHFYENQ